MRIHTDEKEKLLAAWLTQEEYNDQSIMAPLHQICAAFKTMKYQPVIYVSGDGDLAENTAALLCNARRRMEKNS